MTSTTLLNPRTTGVVGTTNISASLTPILRVSALNNSGSSLVIVHDNGTTSTTLHSSPPLVEAFLVTILLVCWVFAIIFFINRWRSLRMSPVRVPSRKGKPSGLDNVQIITKSQNSVIYANPTKSMSKIMEKRLERQNTRQQIFQAEAEKEKEKKLKFRTNSDPNLLASRGLKTLVSGLHPSTPRPVLAAQRKQQSASALLPSSSHNAISTLSTLPEIKRTSPCPFTEEFSSIGP